ncbi:MAG: S53 family peptidase [Candidatus Binataceae bacterium]
MAITGVSVPGAWARSAAAATGTATATTIEGNHPDEAAEFASGPEISASKTLRMQISLALHHRKALRLLTEAQQDPSSPRYHQWLAPGQFNARFGPTKSDVSAVAAWLAGRGFSVESASIANRAIVFTAAAGSAESVFKVKLRTDRSGALYTNLGDPSLPVAIAPLVSSIRGLSNILRGHPDVRYAPSAGAAPDVTIGGISHFGPPDLYAFYDQTPPVNSSNNGGGADCIAVIEDSDFDDPSVAAFDAQFNLPAIDLTRKLSSGSGDPFNTDETETLLDIEYAHAAAPGVPIYAYIGDDATSPNGNGLVDAASAAVSEDVCGAISISFGFCGGPRSFYAHELNGFLVQAAAQGQAFFAATGDNGAAGLSFDKKTNSCVEGTSRSVSELSADPNVTAVGGTGFNPAYDANGNDAGDVAESVWNDASGASGGGSSRFFHKPKFQKGIRGLGSHRAVPDVAFAASPDTPGFFFGSGGAVACCIGGTSLGTPYWAGIAQLATQRAGKTRIGNLNIALYAISKKGGVGIRDVTQGSNSVNGVAGFSATAGYDRASGLGTPDIELLLGAIAGQ